MLQAAMSGSQGGESERLVAAASRGAIGGDAAALSPIVRAVVASVLGESKDHPDVDDCTHEAIRREPNRLADAPVEPIA